MLAAALPAVREVKLEGLVKRVRAESAAAARPVVRTAARREAAAWLVPGVATRFEGARMGDPAMCMLPAAEWISIMGWAGAGAWKSSARTIPASSPSVAATDTFSILTCIAAMNTAIGPITNMDAPTTGSTHGIRITAFMWRCIHRPFIIHRLTMDGPTIPGPRRLRIRWPLGAGAPLPGMDSTALISPPIRCIQAHPCG